MSPDLGLAVAEHARPSACQLVARCLDIRDLIADVVNAAVRTAFEEVLDRGSISKRRDQFDFRIRERYEYCGHAMRRLWHRLRYVGTQRIAIHTRGCREITHRDRDMIEAADHDRFLSPLILSSRGRDMSVSSSTLHLSPPAPRAAPIPPPLPGRGVAAAALIRRLPRARRKPTAQADCRRRRSPEFQ